MSEFNAIGEGGLNKILSNRLSVYGGSPAPTVEPAVFAGLTLENDRAEWGHLKNELLAGKYVGVALVAAQYAMCQLYLPTTARTVAVITRIVCHTAAQTPFITRLVGISGALGGWVALTTCARDTRRNGNGSSLQLERNNNAAPPTNFGALAQLTVAGQAYEDGLVIGPGGAIGIYSPALAGALDITVSWYERPAEAGELV